MDVVERISAREIVASSTCLYASHHRKLQEPQRNTPRCTLHAKLKPVAASPSATPRPRRPLARAAGSPARAGRDRRGGSGGDGGCGGDRSPRTYRRGLGGTLLRGDFCPSRGETTQVNRWGFKNLKQNRRNFVSYPVFRSRYPTVYLLHRTRSRQMEERRHTVCDRCSQELATSELKRTPRRAPVPGALLHDHLVLLPHGKLHAPDLAPTRRLVWLSIVHSWSICAARKNYRQRLVGASRW